MGVPAMVMPVKSIATGDMHPAQYEMGVRIKAGSGKTEELSPRIMPRRIAINMGLQQASNRIFKEGFLPDSGRGISRAGVPQI